MADIFIAGFGLICVVATLVTTPVSNTSNDNLSQIERDAKALEIFLQDKKDHKDYCPNIKWDQPPLSKYKKTLTSHLPDGCKK
jgi:hypothetical protein